MSRQSRRQHQMQIDQTMAKVAIAIKLERNFYWQLLCGILYVESNTGIRVGTFITHLFFVKILARLVANFLPKIQ